MKFSILIAHYNNFEYFKDCYTSIIQQTFQDFEVIIVDDCSTDGSFEKVKDWIKEDSRFKIFQNEENKGVGYTKKKCIELANGEICGFLDPDDALTTDALAISIKYLKEKYIATHSQYYECNKNLKIKQICKTSKKVDNTKPTFFNIFYQVTHFFCFRKSAYERCKPLDDCLTSAIDQDLYLKLAEQGKFYFIKKPLLYYRIHEKGVSQEKSKKIKLRKNWDKVLENTLERRNIRNLYSKPISEINDFASYIYKNQNTLITKILRRII